MRARTIGIAVMILAGLAASIGSGSSKPGGGGGGGGGGKKTSAPHGGSAAKDVRIVSCNTHSISGATTAKVKIVNHSSKTSNYFVTIAFDSQDGKIHYRSSLASHNLAPGRSTEQDTALLKSVSGKVTCKVTAVTRHAS
jgi:hypothetical protein